MHVTIIRPDNKVIVDGRLARIDCSTVPNNYHAVHWHDTEGYIETRTGDNIKLTDLLTFQALIKKAQDQFAAEDEAAKPTLQKAQAAKRQEIDARMMAALGIANLADVLRVVAGANDRVQAVITAADEQTRIVSGLSTIEEVEAHEVVIAVSKAGDQVPLQA